MKAEYKKILEMLPTANREEIKMSADVLYQIIDSLEFIGECKESTIESKDSIIADLKQRIKELESDEEPLLKGKEELISVLEDSLKIKDKRIAFLEEWLKDKDQEIERLRLQVQTNEFNRLFVFGKVGMGKA